jgi:hypothetical protein
MFARERLRECDDAGLAGSIDRLTGRSAAPGVRTDGHHAPAAAARDHRGHDRLGDVQDRSQIDVDDLRPEVRLRLQEGRKQIPARVVDQNVNRADLGLNLRNCGGCRVVVNEVHDHGRRIAAASLDLPHDLFGRRGADIGDDDPRALFGEPPAGGRSDAPAAAGHHNYFIFQASHVSLPHDRGPSWPLEKCGGFSGMLFGPIGS